MGHLMCLTKKIGTGWSILTLFRTIFQIILIRTILLNFFPNQKSWLSVPFCANKDMHTYLGISQRVWIRYKMYYINLNQPVGNSVAVNFNIWFVCRSVLTCIVDIIREKQWYRYIHRCMFAKRFAERSHRLFELKLNGLHARSISLNLGDALWSILYSHTSISMQ